MMSLLIFQGIAETFIEIYKKNKNIYYLMICSDFVKQYFYQFQFFLLLGASKLCLISVRTW